MIVQIGAVPNEIKECALEKFLDAATKVHALAFFQWRRSFHKNRNTFDQDMLVHLCRCQIKNLFADVSADWEQKNVD